LRAYYIIPSPRTRHLPPLAIRTSTKELRRTATVATTLGIREAARFPVEYRLSSATAVGDLRLVI